MLEKNILIVEDDKNISKLVKYNLEKAGFKCFVAFDGQQALDALENRKFDLVVLDLMLPKISGFEVCKAIRQNKKIQTLPIIMLTAKGEETDKIAGFELGADDYVVKPFSPRELVLRIKAILKRGSIKTDKKKILKADGIKLDTSSRRVIVDGREVKLTFTEFTLLENLMSKAGDVQSREKLLQNVWEISVDITTRTVDAHIKRLREKLGRRAKLIETVRAIGYKFKAVK